MKPLTLSQIRKQLISLLKESSALPNRLFIIDHAQKPYGGACDPVFGYDNEKEGWFETDSIEEAIQIIKKATKAELVGRDLHYRLTEWRRDEYLKTWKFQ